MDPANTGRTPNVFLDLENYLSHYAAESEEERLISTINFIVILKGIKHHSGISVNPEDIDKITQNNDELCRLYQAIFQLSNPNIMDMFLTYFTELKNVVNKSEIQHMIIHSLTLNNIYFDLYVYMQAINQFDSNTVMKNRKYEDFLSITSTNNDTRGEIIEKYMALNPNRQLFDSLYSATWIHRGFASYLLPEKLTSLIQKRRQFQFNGVFADFVRGFHSIAEDEINLMRNEYLAILENQRGVSPFAASILDALTAREKPVPSPQARQ